MATQSAMVRLRRHLAQALLFSGWVAAGALCGGAIESEKPPNTIHVPPASATDGDLIKTANAANDLVASTTQFRGDVDTFIKTTSENIKPRPGHRATSTVRLECLIKDGHCTNVTCKNIDGAGYSIDYPDEDGVVRDVATLKMEKPDGFWITVTRSGSMDQYVEAHEGSIVGKYMRWSNDGKLAESRQIQQPISVENFMMGER